VLNIVVRDKRFGGLSRPVIGRVRVPLSIPKSRRGEEEAKGPEKMADAAGEGMASEDKKEEEDDDGEEEKRAEGEEKKRRAEGGSVDNDDASANMQNGLEWWRARRPLLDEELETTLSGVQVEITDQAIVHSLLSGVRAERQGKKGNIHTKMKGRCSPAEKDEGRGGLDETHEVTGRLASGSVPTMMFDEHTGERILDPYETYAVVLDPLDPLDQEFGIEKRVVNVRGCNLRLRQSSCPIESFQLTRYRHANSLKQTGNSKYNALGSSNRGKIKAKGKGGLRSAFGGSGGVFESGGSRQTAGVFKGQIKVLLGTDSPAVVDKRLEEMLRPQNYIIRCYFLTVQQLAKKDKDVFGRDEASDPYLKGRIGNGRGSGSRSGSGGHLRGSSRWRRGMGMGRRGGKVVEGEDGEVDKDEGYPSWFNDRQHFLEDVEDEGDYHRMIQLQCTLPGASKLEISCLDYDTLHIGPDDLIGTTVIDLEDRVFDKRWREWDKQQWDQQCTGTVVGGSGSATKAGRGKSGSKYTKYVDNKPIETRTFLVPTSTQSQGGLTMWLDIMSTAEARLTPPVDISLPAEEMLQVRVVVWHTRGVISGDDFTKMNDLFVKCWIGDKSQCKPKTTDIHWRCQAQRGQKGCSGSFNYRLMFDFKLGKRTWQNGKLHVQLADKDLLKWDDYVGDCEYDMSPRFEQAYELMAFRHNNPQTIETLESCLKTIGVPPDAALRYAKSLCGYGYRTEADLVRLKGAEWEKMGISPPHRRLIEAANTGGEELDGTKETEAKAKRWMNMMPISGRSASSSQSKLAPTASTTAAEAGSLTRLSWEQRQEIVQVFERFTVDQFVNVWVPSNETSPGKAGEGAEGAWQEGRVTAVADVGGGSDGNYCGTCRRHHGSCYDVVYGEDDVETVLGGRRIGSMRRNKKIKVKTRKGVCPFFVRSHCVGMKTSQERGRNRKEARGRKRGKKRGPKRVRGFPKGSRDDTSDQYDTSDTPLVPSAANSIQEPPPRSTSTDTHHFCCWGSRQQKQKQLSKDGHYWELVDERDDEALDEKEEEEEVDELVQALSSAFAELTGDARKIDPPHSEWLPCTRNSKGVMEITGEVCISVEIVPRDLADAMALGSGRKEPNHSPYLPPPVGRMRLTADPFKMMQQVIGFELAGSLRNWLSCCACAGIAVAIMLAFGPLLMSMVQIGIKIFDLDVALGTDMSVGAWGPFIVFGLLLLLVCCCCSCLATKRGRLICLGSCTRCCSFCCPRITRGQ
jgi:hypothetical protein